MLEILIALSVLLLLLAGWLAWRVNALPAGLEKGLEEKHRAMLNDLHGGLTQTRDSVHALKLSLSENLGESREAMIRQLAATTEQLNAKIDLRLEQISGKVSERLDEGFKKTNETFVNVMQRLATIDEAQKKIETLTGSVVSLQELLGDKRSRGAFGEVQLEAIV